MSSVKKANGLQVTMQYLSGDILRTRSGIDKSGAQRELLGVIRWEMRSCG